MKPQVLTVLPVKILSQRNPAWQHLQLGFGHATVGSHGCAVTALAMLLNHVNHQPDPANASHPCMPYTPATVNAALRNKNGFGGPSRNFVLWHVVPGVFPGLQYIERIDAPTRLLTQPELRQIDYHLQANTPVIAYVDASKEEPGLQQHFVLIVGQQTELGIPLINDPWHGDQVPLCPRYGPTPARAIAGLILYDRFAS